MFPYDTALLAAVRTPAQSVADVVGILRAIDSTCADGDGLKWFNWLYLQVTEAVGSGIYHGITYAEPEWMAELDVQFARLYFRAAEAALSGGAPPGCWRVVMDSRANVEVARIQFALAGINAHINHDLAEAIVATCRAVGAGPNYGGTLYRDYNLVNDTLDSMIQTARHMLNVRLLGDALPDVGRLENTLASWNVCAARESAWLNAEHLWRLQGAPQLASRFLDVLDGFTTVIGKALLVPVPRVDPPG